jgi:serine/threonine protein kinase
MIFHHKVDLDYRIIKLYGITQDPETENYVMVMEYANDGSFRKYLNKNYNKLSWKSKIDNLDDIISGLKHIHEKELIHRDLHIGNILKLKSNAAITDMGLCKPANCNTQKNSIYGILPYIAPEILQGQNYTKAADIYSFGIIMYEVISGLPPYYDLSHDENLAIKICQGLRPRFEIKVPQLVVQLIKRCLDADQLNRPTAEEIIKILYEWQYESNLFQTQIKEVDKMNKKLSKSSIPLTNLGVSYKTHSEAIYKSRLFNYSSLPEPKNSDDYYEQNDNIISKEFSGIN